MSNDGKSFLKKANEEFRKGEYETAKKKYCDIIRNNPDLESIISFNLKLIKIYSSKGGNVNSKLEARNLESFYKVSNKYFSQKAKSLRAYLERYKSGDDEALDKLVKVLEVFLDHETRVGKITPNILYEFDDLKYISSHSDVKNAIDNKKIDSGLEHFIFYGWNEVNAGKRRLYSTSEIFDEYNYTKNNKNFKKSIDSGEVGFALEHFVKYGNHNVVYFKKNQGNKREHLTQEIDTKRRTVLICAHIVGSSLFGSERSLIDMVAAVSKKFNVILLAPAMNNIYLTAVKPYVKKVLTLSYSWWNVNKKIDQGHVDEIAKIIKDNNVCLVHVNTIMLREAVLAAKQINVSAITHIRELITGDPDLVAHIGLDADKIIEDVVSRSDYVIGNSKETLKDYGLEYSDKSFMIHNAVNCKEFKAKKLGKIINVGILSSNMPKKGIFDFLKIAEKCQNQNNLFFKLIGPENPHTELIKEKKLSNLKVCGYREHPQEAMDEIDVLVSLSHFKESFGRTVAEAMAASKPVLAYNWGAVPELIKQGETGYLVDYKDTDAIVKHLLDFVKKPSEIERLGVNGRQQAVEYFDYLVYQDKLNSVYETIIEKEKNKKIKIAYFMWHFPVPSETFVLNEIRNLFQQNYDIRVYCKQSPHKDFRPDFPVEWERINDIDDFADKLKKDKREVIHSHFVYPTVTEMVWPASIKSGVPFTFIAHAQDIFRYTNIEKNKIDEVSKSSNCLKVFVPSNFHFNYLLEQGVPPEKMLITPNTIDPDLYSKGLAINHEERQYKSICAIHRFTEKKGLENLIESAKYLDKSIKINIYGYGDLENTYNEIINKNNLTNVEIHAGVKNRQEMLEVFSTHDLFACPSIRAQDGDMDGIPTVLMEAMASGLPVITTAVAGIPDLVVDELTGLVTESEPLKIARDIERFYTLSDSKVKAIRENSRQLIETKFNTFYATDNLLRVWESKTIDLIIVSWNNLPELKEVCHRLLKYTSLPYRLIIVDNNSEHDVVSYLKILDNDYKQVTVVFNSSNDMVGPGTNIALEEGRSDYAIYVCGKEGFVFNYGWEIPLVKYMNLHPSVGQAGTLGYSPTYLYGKDYPKGVALFDKFRNKDFAKQNPEKVFKHVQGGFFILRREMYDEIGGFSYEVPHNYTDVEFSFYVESCGWELGQIPEMMSLYNKTKPGLFSRIDEKTIAIHPPMMSDIEAIEKIVAKTVDLCSICGDRSSKFKKNTLGEHICSCCGSNNADRTTLRYLAESEFTHRRLPALGVNISDSIKDFWANQFQGKVFSTDSLLEELRNNKKIDNSDGSFHLIYLAKLNDIKYEDLIFLIKESERLLHPKGELVIHLNDSFSYKDFSNIYHCFPTTFRKSTRKRFVSEVCHFDWNSILVFGEAKK